MNINSNGGSATLPITLTVTGDSSVILGDVNMDGLINVQDIILVVNMALGLLDPTSEEFQAADVNEDGEISILDIIIIVNMILN